MSDAMEPRYDHKAVEEKIYKQWEESGYFNPDKCVANGVCEKDAEPFSMVLPPPNVTGTLHTGSAAMLVIEDIMTRYARMRGKRTLWIPGTDHAATATQAKVERILSKEEGKTKYDLGREAFLKRVEDFAEHNKDTILNQIRQMGASLDWSRYAYTLDDKRQQAVRTAFKKMYDDGLIYRGNRIVNWDPKSETVISDDEVVHEERPGKLYTFRYNKEFPIPIATTRPETKLGDTAVAVHPDDARYQKYIGEEYSLTFCGVPLTIKIVADASVDKEFGTGAVGVTPAHSVIDWEIAERHHVPLVQVIDERARITVGDETLKGKKTIEARELIVAWLKENNLLEKEEDITQNVSLSERTGALIEPLPKLQWFVDVNKKFGLSHSKINGVASGSGTTLKEIMRAAVANGQIKILPERFEKTYFHWIDNLRDWCISRQLWYGHRIPVWYCMSCGEPHVDAKIKSRWFLVRHGESAWNKEGRRQGGQLTEKNPLTETGIAQVQQATEMLKSGNIGLIISSDLERCRMTAEIISKATGAPIVFEEKLRERFLGEAEGMLKTESDAKHGRALLWGYETAPPGGETWKELETRIWDTFKKHKDVHGRKNVVIVSHGGVLQTLLKKMKNWEFEQMASAKRIENAEITQCSILDPCKKCGCDFYEQDPDTLDTWFSSGMWTFTTLGWPSSAKASEGRPTDLETYHPTTILETGYDILFFWVARMILMTGYLLGDIPFRTVYLHGLVRDERGRKMSKSLDNIVDPRDLIAKYGADALRLALIIGAAPGNDIKLSEDRVRGYRNFSTKIWNIARFIQMNKPLVEKPRQSKLAFTQEDQNDLAEVEKVKGLVAGYLEAYDFNQAGETAYHYVWHTFADKIIEATKPRLKSSDEKEKAATYAKLETILLESLKLLHPFMPFVTEEIYQKLKPGKMLMIEDW